MAKFFKYQGKLCIAVAKENGIIEFINYVSSKTIHEEKLHSEIIFDFDFNSTENIFLTVSKDGTACVYDFEKYKTIKIFKPENPVRFLNCCRILKLEKNFDETIEEIKNGLKKIEVNNLFGNDEVEENNSEYPLDKFVFIVAGGQDSKLVTTTKEGGFEIIGFNIEMEDSIFTHLANFGPVNTLDINNKSRYFVSGSEDSSVKLINLDQLLIANVAKESNTK
jgi:WD40 repeat protein